MAKKSIAAQKNTSKEKKEKKKPIPAVFNPKKPWLWLILVAVIAAVTLTLCLLFIPPKVEISAALDERIVSALRLAHLSEHTEGKYPAVAYEALGVEEKGDTVTVYGVMMYCEYTCTTNDEVQLWCVANSPFALTTTRKADGTYEATDCWWPKNGKQQESSIRQKFPLYCEGTAVNFQDFYGEHKKACWDAVSRNVSAADKYEVLIAENDAVRIGYCPNNTGAYVAFDSGAIEDGNYVIENGVMVCTFGIRRVALKVSDDEYFFDAKQSKDVPAIWTTNGNGTDYLVDGVRFVPAPEPGSAYVGKALTVHSFNWTTLDELQEMFGYVPDGFTFEKNHYLPIKVLKNRAELDWLLAAHMADPQWPDLKQETFTQFDEAFFEKNSLVMVYYNDGMASVVPKIVDYKYTEDGTCLSVRLEVYTPAQGDAVVGQWLLFSGIRKTDMENVKVLEAYVEHVVTDEVEDGGALSFTGTVKQVDGTAVLMECDSVPQFSNGVWVELGNLSVNPVVGETYVVTYEDIVMPSLPPRITAVTMTKT